LFALLDFIHMPQRREREFRHDMQRDACLDGLLQRAGSPLELFRLLRILADVVLVL